MKPQLLAVTIASVALLAASASQAAGYYVDEQSALRLGDAFSVVPPPPPTLQRLITALPACCSCAMNWCSTPQPFPFLQISRHSRNLRQCPITGGQAKTETTDVLPTLYFVNKLTDEMAIGAFINAPYSTGTQFGKQSVARYQATDGEILGIDAGVSLAYRLHEN